MSDIGTEIFAAMRTAGEARGQTLRGPRGGNLNGPGKNNPEHRRAEFRPQVHDNGELGLHRFEDVAVIAVKDEKPWHRMAACLLVEGKTNKQIAALAGVVEETISILKAQRWFQEVMATMTNEIVGPRLERFKAEADASLDALLRLRDFSENEKVVANVSQYILDHAHGKAVQKVVSISASTTFGSEQEEYASIQAELAALRQAKRQPRGDIPLAVEVVGDDLPGQPVSPVSV